MPNATAVGGSPRFAPTKVRPPAVGERLRRRSRLDDLLDETARIALVVAPAGYGKTVAVAQWVDNNGLPVAWFTIDEQDRPAARFWRYVANAFARAIPSLGQETIGSIDEWALDGCDMATVLLAELEGLARPTVLVLDDVHHITDAAIVDQLEFFVERAPSSLTIVLITRSDPPFPMARWRALGLLSEIRQSDLELRPEESAGLLRGVPLLTLDASTEERLIEHTGGWPGALQLAALSLIGRDDADRIVRDDLQNDRMLFDFVVGEVLERLTPEDRHAVLTLSVLDDIDATRCEIMTDCASGDALIRRLTRIGLPIVLLDPRDRTFRFHALFRELVRLELRLRERPTIVDLHRRAARAEQASGDLPAAVRHLLLAGDQEAAFDVVFGPVWDLYRSGATRQVAAWLDQFPVDFVGSDPRRIVAFATALSLVGRLEEASQWNERAAPLVTDDDEVADALALSRMLVDLGRGDTEAVHSAVGRLTPAALHRATHGAQVRLPTVLSIADLIDGAVDDAARWIDAISASPALAERARAVGNPARQAWLAYERGHLDDAVQLADMSLLAAGTEGRGAANAMIELFMVKSMVASERHAFDEADVAADRANELAAVLGAPVYIQLVHAAALAAVEARSGAAAALSVAAELERADAPPPVRDRHRLVTAGIAARSGDWARAERLVADVGPCAMRTLVSARVAISRRRPDAAIALLDGIDTSGWPHRRLIEAEVLRHVCRPGDTAHLRHALDLGVSRGYASSYLREGGVDRATLRRLVDAQPAWSNTPLATALGARPTPAPSDPFVLVEPLSARELEVLQLLPTHLSTVEMAQRTFVSAHTVRTHIKALYRKLAVNSRSEAVRRAAALGLTGATEPQR